MPAAEAHAGDEETMTQRVVLAAAVSLALLSTGCGSKFNYRQAARPANLAEDTFVDIDLRQPALRAASRRILLPGEGRLKVSVEPVNPTAKLQLYVFPEAGNFPVAQGSSPLEVPSLPAGSYYVVVQPQNSIPTRVKLAAAYEPKDPDLLSGDDGKPEGARPLEFGKPERGQVDTLALDRTDYLLARLEEAGTLTVNLRADTRRGRITGELLPPRGEPIPIDLRNGAVLKEAAAGDYLVKIQADATGQGQYTVEALFEAGDPDGNSGEDATLDGANVVSLRPKQGTDNLVAAARDSVDYDARDATDWYRIDVPAEGKLSIIYRPTNRSSRVRADFFRSEDDEGDRIRSGFNVDVQRQSYWVRVRAPDRGDATKYSLDFEFYPAVFIEGDVVEIDRRSGCVLLVNRGTAHQVRRGATANVVIAGETSATGVVDDAYQNMSKVRVFGGACRFNPGTRVQIQGL